MTTIKMTPAELKYHLDQKGSYFFDRSTLKFFGDTMRNYGVRAKPVVLEVSTENSLADKVECWELYRKQPVKHGLSDSAYFNVLTLERVHPKR